MSTQRSSFGKLQRDRTKRERAAAKRERRQDRSGSPSLPESSGIESGELDGEESLASKQARTADVLQRIEKVHQLFDAKTIRYETFEKEKASLLHKLSVD